MCVQSACSGTRVRSRSHGQKTSLSKAKPDIRSLRSQDITEARENQSSPFLLVTLLADIACTRSHKLDQTTESFLHSDSTALWSSFCKIYWHLKSEKMVDDSNLPIRCSICNFNVTPLTLFRCWMIGLGCFYALVGSLMLIASLQDYTEVKEYTRTATLLYGYCLICINVASRTMLERWSPLYREMPVSLQHDSTFLIIDSLSIFLWGPASTWWIYKIFLVQDIPSLLQDDQFQQTSYLVSSIYLLDRLIHLIVSFRCDRFVHHMLVCLWVLFSQDWLQEGTALF